MKWYSEEELKKNLGHCITLPLLDQMACKERITCGECKYWNPLGGEKTGFCKLLELSYRHSITFSTDDCKQGFSR